MKRILIIGSAGQIGSELTLELRKIYGGDGVIAGYRSTPPSAKLKETGPCEIADANNVEQLVEVVKKYKVDCIVNMAAILSATGEADPKKCWDVNMNGLYNVLEIAREFKMEQVLVPSSIAAFGPSTPRFNTPQETILKPTTMYGVTKVAGELLGDYYVRRFGLDVRGLRYPGIISYETLPGGGTTDYAVAIYYDAVQHGSYKCFVNAETRLPMMYMPDCLKATIDLMQADFSKLKHHSDFNVGAMSFSAAELADSIREFMPDFTITYEPDRRQAIADSWPQSVDDSAAREEWGWKPAFDLKAMTHDMLLHIGEKFGKKVV